jgi:tetratricopeptide (TPR) repeat protein
LLLVCAVQCPRLAAVFHSGETLWTHVAAAEPTNAEARMNLANWYAGSDPAQPGVAHDLARAEALYLEALALQPQKASIHYDLGLLAERQGRLDEALARYREADRLRARGHLRAALQAAGVLRKQRRFEAAATLYAALARQYPHAAAEAEWRTALTWEEAGRPQAAAEALRAFLRRTEGQPAFAARAAEARRRLGEE